MCSIWLSPSSSVLGSSGSSSVFSGVFIAGKVDEVGATTMGDVQVHLEASLNISLKSAWFTDESLSW